MSLKHVGHGTRVPDEINVVVEIPANTGPVKYEVDKDSGAVFVDRFMATSMFYPCNDGCLPDEAGDDAKIVAVPVSKVTGVYDRVQAAADLPEGLIHTIEHCFAHYKDLERGKWVKVRGRGDAAVARAYLDKALHRFTEGVA